MPCLEYSSCANSASPLAGSVSIGKAAPIARAVSRIAGAYPAMNARVPIRQRPAAASYFLSLVRRNPDQRVLRTSQATLVPLRRPLYRGTGFPTPCSHSHRKVHFSAEARMRSSDAIQMRKHTTLISKRFRFVKLIAANNVRATCRWTRVPHISVIQPT